MSDDRNIKYLGFKRIQNKEALSSTCFSQNSQDKILQQALKVINKAQNLDLRYEQKMSLNSEFGRWYFTNDHNFSYFILCEKSYPSDLAYNLITQFRKNHLDKRNPNLTDNYLKKMIGKELIKLCQKYQTYHKKQKQQPIKNDSKNSKKIQNPQSPQKSKKYNISFMQSDDLVINMEDSTYNSFHLVNQMRKQPIKCKQSLSEIIADQQEIKVETSSYKRRLLIGIVVIVVILALLGAGLGLGFFFTNKNLLNQNEEGNTGNQPSNSGGVSFTCQNNPLCQGVSASIQSYIMQTYSDPNQGQSLLQAAQSLSMLSLNQTESTSIQNYIDQAQAIQCLYSIFGQNYVDHYTQLQKITLDTEEKLVSQLQMIALFGQQNIQLSTLPEDDCDFLVNQTARRMLMKQNQSQQEIKEKFQIKSRLLVSPTQQQCTALQTGDSADAVLVYFNGVGSTPGKSMANLNRIKRLIKQNSNLQFSDYVNQGPGKMDKSFFIDLVTSFEQEMISQGQSLISRTQLLKQMLDCLGDLSSSYKRLKGDITKKLQDYTATYITQQVSQNLADNNDVHKALIKKHLLQGKKIVLVAHSQGSLYANQVYNSLSSTQKHSVALVYIAPLASSMADSSSNWITNPSDKIVELIKNVSLTNSAFMAPLQPNVPAQSYDCIASQCISNDLFGYADAYQTKIMEMITNAKASLVQPIATASTGIITVTLTWDAQPDIDLHIFEPSPLGKHVFYSYKQGYTGYLDVDDVTSYGPEHYYGQCTKLLQGIYKVKINYYSGYGASQIVVNVLAGNYAYTKALSINPPRGYSGDANPQHYIADIQVSRNTRNKIQFKITPQL